MHHLNPQKKDQGKIYTGESERAERVSMRCFHLTTRLIIANLTASFSSPVHSSCPFLPTTTNCSPSCLCSTRAMPGQTWASCVLSQSTHRQINANSGQIKAIFAYQANPSQSYCQPCPIMWDHRWNLELDLQSLFGRHVQSCTHCMAENPHPPPTPPIYEGAIGQPR